MNHNHLRLTEDIKREVSAAMRDLKDARVGGMVSVTRCELTADQSYLKVLVSFFGTDDKEKSLTVLRNASGFFKKRINDKIKMRKMPEIVFELDESLDYYEKIDGIIKNLPPAPPE